MTLEVRRRVGAEDKYSRTPGVQEVGIESAKDRKHIFFFTYIYDQSRPFSLKIE